MGCFGRWFIFAVTVWEIEVIRAQESFTCLSCSYTTSALPTVGYGCIRNPNEQTSIDCEPPRACKTIAIMNKEKTVISSAFRGCLPIVKVCASDNCCNDNGIYSTQCEETCSEPSCNTFDPEQWLHFIEGNTLLPRTTPFRRATTTDKSVTDGSGDNSNQTGSSGTIIFIPEDLFHVNTGTRHFIENLKLFTVICTVKLFTYLLFK